MSSPSNPSGSSHASFALTPLSKVIVQSFTVSPHRFSIAVQVGLSHHHVSDVHTHEYSPFASGPVNEATSTLLPVSHKSVVAAVIVFCP